MGTNSRRIGIDLLDDVLKEMINASAKIIPVDYTFVQTNLNPNNYEFVVVVSEGEYKNHIFRWDNGWQFIGANDVYITWEEIKHKPTEFEPKAHNHDTLYSKINHVHDYAPAIHNHDTVYSKLNHEHDYSPSTHNHDSIYSKITHNHDSIYSKIDHVHDYSPSTHNHDETYASKSKELEIADLQLRLFNIENGYTEGHRHANLSVLDGFVYDTLLKFNGVEVSLATHNHDGAYYKKSDVDSKLSSKLEKTHATDTSLHFTPTQKERIDNVQTSYIGNTQPTTDVWYKTI